MPAPAALPHRDNLFGVCHAIGCAFGFDPLYLRLLFMLAVLVDFRSAAFAYALAGLAVLVSAGVDRLTALNARAARQAH